MEFLPILLIHFFALLAPGPDFFLVSAYALKTNLKRTLWVVFGIVLSSFLWIIASLSGLKFLFEAFPLLYLFLSSLGIFYLFYLSFFLLKNLKQEEEFRPHCRFNGAFINGFLTNISNVKVLFYFIGIFSNLNFSYDFPILSLLVLILVVESFLYFTTVALLFSNVKIKNLYFKHRKKIDFLCSILFIFFALWMIKNLCAQFV